MKKTILLALLIFLIPAICLAGSVQDKLKAVVSAGGATTSTDSCTGGLIFSWHCENTDVTLGGIAGGVNNGCSAGDTTAAGGGTNYELNASVYKDGIKGCHFPNRNSYYQFAISSEDIVKHATGTWAGWVYIDTFVTGSPIWRAQVDASNVVKLNVLTATTNQFRVTHTAGGTARTATTTITDGLLEDTWYYVVFKWDETVHGSNYLSICADTTNGTSNCGAATSALGSWSGTLATMEYGDVNVTTNNAFYVDQVKIYDSWQ